MAPSAAPHARVSLEEREVHRIYQPWLSAHGSSLNVANHIESLALDDLEEQGYQARSSRDKALTAFAQLVALRLDVRRCMISLIDTSNQYILAEATRTVSIASSRTAEDDELWLGSAVLSRTDAVCEHCLFNSCTAVDDSGATLTARGLIVPDCRLDDRFKDRPYVVSEPGVRFYAGVPIYSRNGYMIGACAVSDEHPRATLKIEELKLMQETAQSVIEHLECKSLLRSVKSSGYAADAAVGMLSLAVAQGGSLFPSIFQLQCVSSDDPSPHTDFHSQGHEIELTASKASALSEAWRRSSRVALPYATRPVGTRSVLAKLPVYPFDLPDHVRNLNDHPW